MMFTLLRVTPSILIVNNVVPDDWGIATSDNGWMKLELFIEYILNIFHPHFVKKGIEFPQQIYLFTSMKLI